MTAELDKLRAYVRSQPDDWQARKILADCLEDAGLCEAAEGQRWQATEQKYPELYGDHKTYGWYNVGQSMHQTNGDLNSILWNELSGYFMPDGRTWIRYRWFPSLDAAESALARAIAALRLTAKGTI